MKKIEPECSMNINDEIFDEADANVILRYLRATLMQRYGTYATQTEKYRNEVAMLRREIGMLESIFIGESR